MTEQPVALPRPRADEPQKPKRTILYLDHTASLGGGEIALLNLVQSLNTRRYHPIVVLSAEGPLQARLVQCGVETHILPISKNVGQTRKDSLGLGSLLRVGTVLQTLGYSRRLAAFMREKRVDLVHTNSLKADIMGGIAARLARVPVIWHVRDRIENDYLPAPVVRVFRWLCNVIPDYIIANSEATLGTLNVTRVRSLAAIPSGLALRWGHVIHDGVSEEALRTGSPLTAANSAPLIGLVGRISPWKGQHIFIRAAAEVRSQHPNARFQIIGSALFGEEVYEREVRDLATSLGLDDCLEWMGFRSDVPNLIQKLDLLVHASTSGEPFGQVVVEGMAAGKPVVATNGGGVPEIVEHNLTGLLVPMGDAPAMATAILHFLDNPDLAARMGQAGRQRVMDKFTIDQTARKVESVYEELLQRRDNATPPLPRPAAS